MKNFLIHNYEERLKNGEIDILAEAYEDANTGYENKKVKVNVNLKDTEITSSMLREMWSTVSKEGQDH